MKIGNFYIYDFTSVSGRLSGSSVSLSSDLVVGKGGGGGNRVDLAEILFQSFLWEAIAGSSGIGRHVHSLTLSVQHFFFRQQSPPPSEVP